MTSIATTYLACWNETDAAARRALLDNDWSDAVTYVDPMVDVTGRDQLDATIAAVQAQFPGFTFSLLGDVDAHHQQVRFRWGLGPSGAEPVTEGFDVIATDTDGKIAKVLGFLDTLPSYDISTSPAVTHPAAPNPACAGASGDRTLRSIRPARGWRLPGRDATLRLRCLA